MSGRSGNHGWTVRFPQWEQLETFTGHEIPSRMTATAIKRGLPEVQLEIVLESGRYRVRSLTMPTGITGEALRRVPVENLLRRAVHLALGALPIGQQMPRGGSAAKRRIRRQGPTDETLQWVATLYLVGYLAGDPPTEFVAKTLGVPRSTAGRWVAAARAKDFLGPARPRRAGEAGPPKRRHR